MMFRAYLEKRLPTRPLRRQEVYNSHISHTVVSKGTISGLRNQPFTCPYDNVDSVLNLLGYNMYAGGHMSCKDSERN